MKLPHSTRISRRLLPGCLAFPSLLLVILLALPAMQLLAVPASAGTTQGGQTHALDQSIAKYLQRQFASNNNLKDVQVSVSDRVVTLSGTVPDYRSLLNANDMARGVQSVNGVIDHLTVNAPQVEDAKLRNEIAQRLTYSRFGMGQIFNGIKVAVNNGVVTLSGQVVDYPSRDSAVSIASDTKGVRRVVDHIKVAPLSPFDNQIRYEAYRAIYNNPNLLRYAMNPAHTIRILVNNGHVTLWGVVNNKMDKQLAYQAVMGLPNVFSVKNDLVVAGGGK